MCKFKRFGVMLDMSRNAVMKPEQVKRFIDLIQGMGYNALGLYVEDTYEIKDEPYFGYLRGRYTGEEIKDIDSYAKSKGVEVIPYIQTLAHLSTLASQSAYQGIFDIEDVLLIDEPKTYELIEKMFKACSEHFSSRNINIGMDEAFKVGLGKYLKKHGFCDRYEIILRHLNKVVDIAVKYGFKPTMWSDMFFRIACDDYLPAEISESVKKLVPEKVGLDFWDYYRKDKAFVDNMFVSHKAFGREVGYVGGAWTWHGFAPLAWQTLSTMRPSIQSAIDNGIENVMIAMWGDNGHECSFYALIHTLYAISQFAQGNFDMDSIKEGFKGYTGLDFDDFMLLDLPNINLPDDVLGDPSNPCKVLLYQDVFLGKYDHTVENNPERPFGEYAIKIGEAKKRVGEYAYVFDFYHKLCLALEIKAGIGVKLRKAYKAGNKEGLKGALVQLKELEQRIKDLHSSFFYLWHKENKGHGFEVHDARLGGLIMRISTCAKRLNDYLEGKIDCIEELEEIILKHGDGKTLRSYSYLGTITNNRV